MFIIDDKDFNAEIEKQQYIKLMIDKSLNNKYIIGFDPYLNDEGNMVICNNNNGVMENKKRINNPKELEYWRNIFPTKTDNELEEYRVKWSKENPKYLKFNKL